MRTHLILVTILMVMLTLAGCADVTKVADKTFIDTSKVPMLFYSVDKEAERMLYEAMYTSPVQWNQEDLENVLSARGTLKMAAEYLNEKEKLTGGITFFTLREFLNFTTYAFTIYEKGADGRAAQKGTVRNRDGQINEGVPVLTDREQWIYNKVKDEVWSNLKALRAYINIVSEDINNEVNDQTLARFKEAFKIVENIIPVKLPSGLDF